MAPVRLTLSDDAGIHFRNGSFATSQADKIWDYR
jgi:hypothetical protein